jgi:hypothetical protein
MADWYADAAQARLSDRPRKAGMSFFMDDAPSKLTNTFTGDAKPRSRESPQRPFHLVIDANPDDGNS